MNVLIRGICGHMGGNILDIVNADPDTVAVCGVDPCAKALSVPVYPDFASVTEHIDVIIDFSSPKGIEEELAFAKERKCGIVLGTTGFSKDDLAMIEEAASSIPVFQTANLSIGVNLLQMLVKQAAAFLGSDFDVEIIEKHHHLKKDAPSGTALMLAASVNEGRDGALTYVNGREGIVGARKQNELGIHAVRGGTIVGEHEVLFCGEDEIVTLSHSARSKRVFASGAVRAAKWLVGKSAGKYDMNALLADQTDLIK